MMATTSLGGCWTAFAVAALIACACNCGRHRVERSDKVAIEDFKLSGSLSSGLMMEAAYSVSRTGKLHDPRCSGSDEFGGVGLILDRPCGPLIGNLIDLQASLRGKPALGMDHIELLERRHVFRGLSAERIQLLHHFIMIRILLHDDVQPL